MTTSVVASQEHKSIHYSVVDLTAVLHLHVNSYACTVRNDMRVNMRIHMCVAICVHMC